MKDTQDKKPVLKYAEITESIIGAAMEVHNHLGGGFQEVIYQRALALELNLRKLNFAREFEMEIFYKNAHIGTRRVDFLIENTISLEIKALTALEPVHFTQAINYLEAYQLETGLLINFGGRKLEFKRLYNNKFQSNNPMHK